MDELFWGRDHEDVNDWAERLTMVAEVRNLNGDKLFKIAKLNLRGRAKEWFKRLQPTPADWAKLRTLIVQKYGDVDADDIRMKLDAIKQEPKERVQKYFERLDKLFQKGRLQDAEQKRRFLARLRPEIRKLCVVRTFADIEELVSAATEVERVLGKLRETPQLRRASWIGLLDENWSSSGHGMRSTTSETWSWDQCGGLAVDNGELATEDEFGNSGAGGIDHLEGHARRWRS
ncbi:unnamed protein product [Sphagnum jensenii]